MFYKTFDDVQRVIDLRKPAEIVNLFIISCLTGQALATIVAAEAEYAELQAQSDQMNIARIEELVAEYPHLVDSGDGTVVVDRRPNPDLDIDQMRQLKLLQIKSDFEAALASGRVVLSLGWIIDCRRSAKAEDVSNMERLLKLCQSSGMSDNDEVMIRGSDNIDHLTTVSVLRDVIIPEMYQYGLDLYQKKWHLESAIAGASGIEDVLAVQWR